MLPGMTGLLLSSAGSGGTLSASISATSITKTKITTSGSAAVTTGPVVVTPSGVSGGYSYSWVNISGDVAIAAGAPTSASTTFSATLAPDETKMATLECTVTDGSGFTVKKDVAVTLNLVFVSLA